MLVNKETKEEQVNALGKYLPNGRLWGSKNIEDSNLRKMLWGLACEVWRVDNKIDEVIEEYFPDTTTQLIEEWESALGIPDQCFSVTGKTQEERRDQIIVKLTASGVQTAQDFIDLGLLFGLNITIDAGADRYVFPLKLPYLLGTPKQMRFTMVVNFSASQTENTLPLLLPYKLGGGTTRIVECFFRKLKPANVRLISIFT